MRRYGRKTAQGVWQPPALCAMVTAWFRQRRNTRPRSAAGRIKRHSRLVADVTDRSRVQRWCQQSSSEQASYRSLPHSCESSLATLLLLSKSNPLRWASIWFWNWQQGSSPYCIRTDLVQNQKETGFRKQSASYFEVLLLQGVPATVVCRSCCDFFGNQAETDECAKG